MKKIFFSTITAMALGTIMLSSCCKGSAIEDEERVPVKFGSSLRINTKAYDATWEGNDEIGVFMVDNATKAIYSATNKGYHTIVGGTGSIAFSAIDSNDIYYPADGTGLDFFAYYPFDSALASPYDIAVNLSSAQQADQEAIDIMWSGSVTNKTKASTNVNLPFDHKLSKIVINIVKGVGLTTANFSSMTMKITGMNTAATFNALSGALTLPGTTPADIVPFQFSQGLKYEAIVLPETVTNFGMEFSQNLAAPNNGVFEWIKTNETFAAGSKYTYTMTINPATVEFTCSITAWTDVPRTETAN